MTIAAHHHRKSRLGGYVVAEPRTTDVIARTLRNAFEASAVPDDMMHLLRRLDRVSH